MVGLNSEGVRKFQPRVYNPGKRVTSEILNSEGVRELLQS